MRVLVIGGAGYIGSHMVKRLGAAGFAVVTLDNLSSGRREAATYGEFVEGDLGDRDLLDDLFSAAKFDGVMHFAAHIEVAESVGNPEKYYRNNVASTLVLLEAMRAHSVNHLVFSSSAAVYGEPRRERIDENHPAEPVNPYGRSKLMVEHILRDFEAAYGLRSMARGHQGGENGHWPAGSIPRRPSPPGRSRPPCQRFDARGNRTRLAPAPSGTGNDYRPRLGLGTRPVRPRRSCLVPLSIGRMAEIAKQGELINEVWYKKASD